MDLKDVRCKIDAIDDQLAKLFKDRMDLSREVALSKKESGTPVENSERERQIISRVTEDMPDEYRLYAKRVYSTLFEVSKAYQYATVDVDSKCKKEINEALAEGIKPFPLRASVACQGVYGAFSGVAAGKIFEIPSISYFKTWDGVFKAVEQGFCEYGVLPIENSLAGSVIGVYDLMKKHKFYIVRSVKMRINHYLLALDGTKLEDVKEVISHDQALMQCGEFLDTLKGVKLTRCDNTAAAAKLIKESGRHDVACISSKECAGIYGLKVLKSGIEGSGNNFTRFIAISKKMLLSEGSNRISVTLNLAHEAGSLNAILNKFSALGLNLTKLESRPMPASPFEFTFYFDFEADVRKESVKNLLSEIEQITDNFTFLGAYEEL